MAIAHLSLKAYSRGKGESAICKSAYNAGKKLHDSNGTEFDFKAKGGIKYSQLLTANGDRIDRQEFWNSVEKKETRCNACLCRELEISLPIELNYQQQKNLAMEFTQKIIKKYDLEAADLSIHVPWKYRKRLKANTDAENPHFHLLIPDRDKSGKKLRQLSSNRSGEVDSLRQLWERTCNNHLERSGSSARIDMRSYENQISELDREIIAIELEMAKCEAQLRIFEEEFNARQQHIRRNEDGDRVAAEHNAPDQPAGRGIKIPEPAISSEIRQPRKTDERNSGDRNRWIQADQRQTGRAGGTADSGKRPGGQQYEIRNRGSESANVRNRAGDGQALAESFSRRLGEIQANAQKIAQKIEALRIQRNSEFMEYQNKLKGILTHGQQLADRLTALRIQRSEEWNAEQDQLKAMLADADAVAERITAKRMQMQEEFDHEPDARPRESEPEPAIGPRQ